MRRLADICDDREKWKPSQWRLFKTKKDDLLPASIFENVKTHYSMHDHNSKMFSRIESPLFWKTWSRMIMNNRQSACILAYRCCSSPLHCQKHVQNSYMVTDNTPCIANKYLSPVSYHIGFFWKMKPTCFTKNINASIFENRSCHVMSENFQLRVKVK